MKPFFATVLFLCFLFGEKTKAQDSISWRSDKFYRISLKLIPKKMKNKHMGFLVWITDSTLYYSSEKMSFSSNELNDSSIEKINFLDLKSATLYTSNPASTILIPAFCGLAVGAIIGFASGDDPPGFLSITAPEKALALGTAGFALGAIVGGALAAAQHHFYNIKGRQEKYLELVKFVKVREFVAAR